jgi:hypothetical protein
MSKVVAPTAELDCASKGDLKLFDDERLIAFEDGRDLVHLGGPESDLLVESGSRMIHSFVFVTRNPRQPTSPEPLDLYGLQSGI